ncbi:uncharacterized protein LOC116205834 [Punica granatum]|uniref:Uncharacterized protein LOC116205834 n=1 Tax=Punica granatum TaxID=22663 RepID=A0A6P8DB19_PUNGR|nr:uncharacterized protein LOC116205834 [Punica granatum]
METDCVKHVKHCHLCQVYANQIKAPPNELHPMAASWPFSMWGMDVIGPISPKASNGHLFILVAIDYFTKWIEAITLASVTVKAVARFLKRDIIARYEVPATLIMDNAKNLNNKLIDELCSRFKIQHRNSSPYRLQMNAAVEASNKNIKKIIAKMTVNYKDWHEIAKMKVNYMDWHEMLIGHMSARLPGQPSILWSTAWKQFFQLKWKFPP